MVTPTYPGVYVREVPSSSRPITIASTSTAAFVGIATKGPIDEAVRIFSFSDFEKLYGAYRADSFLAHSVFQYFNNGGSVAYIVRVVGSDPTNTNNPANASMTLMDRGSNAQSTITIEAASPGIWGNALEIEITAGTSDPANEFNLNVYEEGSNRPVETFENINMLSTASNYITNVISNSNYISVTVLANSNSTGVDAIGTSVAAGAANLPVDDPVNEVQMRINIDNDGFQDIDLNVAVTDGTVTDLSTAANVVTALQHIVRDLLSKNHSTTPDAAYDNFSAVESSGIITLRSGSNTPFSSVVVAEPSDRARDITGYLRLGRLNGGMETIGAAVLRPINNTSALPRYLLGDHADVGGTNPVASVTRGSDGPALANDQPYIDALNRLDNKDDVSIITIPGVSSPSLVGDAMNYCENRNLSDCFFIGDLPEIYDEVGEAQAFVGGISPKNSYGAMYWPWLRMNDPLGGSEPIVVPPSGFVAGLYAKTDAKRGVWKAPAGTSAGVAGANGVTVNLTNVQQGLLNPTPYHVNVIREFPAAGRVIWGARTITSDASWNFVPVRRMAILIRVSIYNGIQWAVFEPNDVGLWSQLRLNITAFMMTLFRRGAFQGATPSEAFFVKVDSETTTQADIDAGIVNIRVGFAPLKPAEFAVVLLSQKAGQAG
ncbi:hypothetical protein SAMN05216326_1327 [Nitrosomonas marina]|uniref:Tail sheath protein C-terminal domain-containing protein n=1 Tax=Nitrosomonas marina TaxID=917 RepID=A0A1I0F0I9_9PROT|nr:phage tail sheath subtilisin-like domain-containing protein [Nitrosomonas marina]SET51452.1 hypothetical protein SAMN05216326_1327 [Nitrosomonas marina]